MVYDDCLKCIAGAVWFLWGLETQTRLGEGGQHCARAETWQMVFVCWGCFFEDLQNIKTFRIIV